MTFHIESARGGLRAFELKECPLNCKLSIRSVSNHRERIHFGGIRIEWFSAPFPAGMSKPWQMVPVDENGDGRIDLVIDQDGGAGWNFLRVLRSVAEPSPHIELVAQGGRAACRRYGFA